MMKKLKGFLLLWILLMAAWLLGTGTFEIQELVTGLVLSAGVALVFISFSSLYREVKLTPKSILLVPVYLVVFLWEMLKANLDVARRVLTPSLPINPGVVEIETGLQSRIGKLLLANSITLTPGTLTMDVTGNRLTVHWIDVKAYDPRQAAARICGKFERLLREIVQ